MPQLIAAGEAYEVQAILFDKDGTLLDFVHTWGSWSGHVFARFVSELKRRELPPPKEDLALQWGLRRAADGSFAGYDRSGPLAMGTADDLLAILAWQGYRLGLPWTEAKRLAQENARHADGELERTRAVRPLPGVVPFLERCRAGGLKLAVVTADATDMALRHLEWLGIGHYFDACVGTDQAARGKPHPEMAELACSRLGVSCSQAAVIGDTNGDMKMARAAGAAAAIGIAGPEEGEAERLPDADAIVASFRELAIGTGEGGRRREAWGGCC